MDLKPGSAEYAAAINALVASFLKTIEDHGLSPGQATGASMLVAALGICSASKADRAKADELIRAFEAKLHEAVSGMIEKMKANPELLA